MIQETVPEAIETARTLIDIAKRRYELGSREGDSWFSNTEAEGMYKIGFDLFKQNRFDKALTIFSLLVVTSKESVRFLTASAVCQKMLKRFDVALRLFEEIETIDPGDPVIAMHISECLLFLGRKDEAVRVLTKTLDSERGRGDQAMWSRAEQRLAMLAG